MNRVPELLAPAGDLERMKGAIRFGADAVYLGGSAFGMRAASANFGGEALKEAVDYAHRQGVKVYLTCNTLPRNEEIPLLPEFLRQAGEAGVDAVIVADMGVLMAAKRVIPQVDVHISTQAGVVNYLTASAFWEMGAKRVVLARELSLDEIRTIREKTPPQLEIEAFVHGAMCMSFSGRCLLSQYMVNRDANRGECAQPCRWGYHLVEEKRPGQYFPIIEGEKGSYILNAKDLCMIEHIKELAEAGIDSFKIEGRAKSLYYVAVITNAYRCALDGYRHDPERYQTEPWLLEEVKKVSHRQYSTGFYYGPPQNGQFYEDGGYVRTCDIVAVVDKWENGILYCTQRNRFQKGEKLEILSPGEPPCLLTAEGMTDEEGIPLEIARHAMMKIRIPSSKAVPSGSILRR